MPQRLSSSDSSTNWPDAYSWLKSETYRLGWLVGCVEEDGRRITGKIFLILGPLSGNMVQVRTTDHFTFEIVAGQGDMPIILLRKENWAESFLVYHEYPFYGEAVYSVHALVGSQSETEARNSCFVDEIGRNRKMLKPFSWWGVLLRRELRTYEQGDARRKEIRRIVNGWKI